jgi:predicted enzyme related to lactoylglutathione lyase
MGLSIAHIAITAADMDESMRFYTQAIGLSKAFELAHPETGAPWIVYMKVADNQFVELFYSDKSGIGTQAAGDAGDAGGASSQAAGFEHLCFCVDDIAAAAKKIEAAGFELTSGPEQGSDGNWQCWTADPNGIRIEMMQISPESPQAKSLS